MERKYFANVLSALRPALALVICCVVVGAIISGERLPLWLIAVWAALALTDYFDGMAARSKFFGKTENGETVDEMCDKIAVNLVLCAMCAYGRIGWYFFAVMLGRDVFITVVRWRSKKAGINVVKGAKLPGKIKTCFQFMLVLVALFPASWLGGADGLVIFGLSALAMGTSLVSGMQILLLAMDAKDPSWLEGAGGEIGAPNWCSLARMAVSAVIPYVIGTQPFGGSSNVIAVIMLAIAISTDKVDGFLAQKLHKFTKAGKALDPLSDKILFYPIAIAMFLATSGSFLVPGAEHPAVGLVVWMSLALMVIRDLAFIIWFGLTYRNLPEGISSSGWDKARMVAMCVWLGAMALAMCTQGLPIGTALAWIAYICLIVAGLVLSFASGAVAIWRVQQLKVSLKIGGSE